MVKVSLFGREKETLDFTSIEAQSFHVAREIETKTGAGNDFLGWLNFASKLPEEEIVRIEKTAKRIRENYDTLVVCGIGGSYLGARAVIEALNGLFPEDNFEIIFFGNTLSPDYTAQVLKHLEHKHFAINVISKSETTTETAVSFRLLKELFVKKFGEEELKDAVVATTDRVRGSLKFEADEIGYETFVIPDDIGGRYSVITPVGLLPIACAGIDIREFIRGVIDGEKMYSGKDFHKNPAYYYGAIRYLMKVQDNMTSEMFVTYHLQYQMIGEWLKQLFDESEGKDGKALLCTSATFTTDLHSMGQFIQQGAPVLFETIIHVRQPKEDVTVKADEKNYDNLNYLAGKEMSFICEKAYEATLKAHTEGHTPAVVLDVDMMNAYSLGNLMYFFFRACAFSAYLLEVNPFNQPGVEIYKKNMFELLGKPGYKK